MKVAFALIPEKGHVNPYMGPAQALADAGHEVVVAAPGDIAAQLTRAGLQFHRDLILAAGDERVTRGAELVLLIQDPERLHSWIEQLLLGGLPEGIDPVRAWYRRERPDAVVVDPLYYAAAIAAHTEGIPWASVSNSLNPVIPPDLDSALLCTVRDLSARRAAVFQSCGFDAQFSGCDVLSPYLNIAFATEAFVGPAPAHVKLVGPSLPLHDRGDEPNMRPLYTQRHLVYASFGSQIYHWPEVFEKIVAAGNAAEVHLILSIGDLVDNPHWRVRPPHCDLYRYAPQMRILRHASAFITHGGANSVMEAIYTGVPMLISPMCNDQFHQAWFVERAGIGIVQNLVDAPVERIAEALRELLPSVRIRSNIDRISRTFQANGSLATAKLIADLVSCPPG